MGKKSALASNSPTNVEGETPHFDLVILFILHTRQKVGSCLTKVTLYVCSINKYLHQIEIENS